MVKVINPEADPDDVIRYEWGVNLSETMAELHVTPKDLQHRLALVGIQVTHQGISMWTTGQRAPRPSVQAAIAHVLSVPSRTLFPLVYKAAA